MKIIGVNGIHSHGEDSTDILLEHMRPYDYEVDDFDYPKVNIFEARSRAHQKRLGLRLLKQSEDGDVVIAHSFGCLLTLRAMEQGAKFSAVIFLSAAMTADFIFPYHGMKALLNIHNPADKALWMARFVRWGDLGEMGSLGYNGAPDSRVENYKSFHSHSGCLNHNHYFIGETTTDIARRSHYFIEETLSHDD